MNHSTKNTLAVFMNEHLVGSLYNETPLAFSYEPVWLNNPAAIPLTAEIPFQTGKINSSYVHAFFENLLPEGDQRKLISLSHHVSTLFALLATAGGDTAGSIQLLPPNQSPQPPQYQSLGVKKNYLMQIADEMAKRLEINLVIAAQKIVSSAKLVSSEYVMAERITQKILSIAKKNAPTACIKPFYRRARRDW
jgi:HipA-like protein